MAQRATPISNLKIGIDSAGFSANVSYVIVCSYGMIQLQTKHLKASPCVYVANQ